MFMALCLLIILLIIPLLMLLYSKRFLSASSQMGSKQGFFCPSAMRSSEVWAFAQNTASLFFRFGGIALAVFSLFFACVIPVENALSLALFASILVGFQSSMLIFVMAGIEMRVQNRFSSSAA